MNKKLLSVLVAVLMVLAVLPMNAFAFGTGAAKEFVPLKTKAVKEPTRSSVVYSTDFETDPASDGWTFTDSDGDGNNWTWSTDWVAHSGSGIIYSESYKSSALNPDNWAWSPSFTVPATGYTYVQFYYAGELPAYASEVFAVYAKVNGSNVKLTDDITAVGGYKDVIADVTAYAGQTIQVAIRHYNCTDMYMLNVDTFGIYNLDSEYDDGITNVYTNSFETSSDLSNITGYDVDGDGDWWGRGSSGNGFAVMDGQYALVSQSANYDSSTQTFTAIEGVDNVILFQDAFEVPANGGAVSIWAASADLGHQEHFSFLVGTVDAWDNENSEDDIYIVDDGDSEFIATFLYEQFWIDLTEFAGQSVYIAIEHHNNPGDVNYFLQIDYLEYWTYDEAIEPETHTVTFKDWDGTVLSTQTVTHGSAATAPADPTREGYTFSGWDVDFSNVTEDLIVTATYTINSYTLTIVYQYEDGTEAAETYRQRVEYGAAYSVTSPVIPGYTADILVVEGTMGTAAVSVTVTYTKDAPAGLLGDVNCDGVVDMKDVTALNAYLVNAGELTAQGLINADVSGTDGVTAYDATLIAMIALGISLP